MAFPLPPPGERVAIRKASLIVTTGHFRIDLTLPVAQRSPIPEIPTTTLKQSALLSPRGPTRALGQTIAIQIRRTSNQIADRHSQFNFRNASTFEAMLVGTS